MPFNILPIEKTAKPADLISKIQDEHEYLVFGKIGVKESILNETNVHALKVNHDIIHKLDQKINRLTEIINQEKTCFFVIPATATLNEIKELLNTIQKRIEGSNDPAEKLLLVTLQEAAESCKEFRTHKGAVLTDVYIPILTRELNYSAVIMTNTHLDLLTNNPPNNSPNNPIDYKAIKEMYNHAVNKKNHLGFFGKESDFLKKLQTIIEEEIFTLSQDNGASPKNTLTSRIEQHMKSLDLNKDYSYQFKKLINDFCEIMNWQIKPFLITDTKESLKKGFYTMKARMQEAHKTSEIKSDPQGMEPESQVITQKN